MADDVEITIDQDRLQRALREHPEKLLPELKKRVTPYLTRWVRREMAGNRFVNFRPGGTRGDRLHRRTGDLSRSFDVRTFGTSLDTLHWVTGSFGVKYANVHEHGATIHAKPGRALAVPIGEALTPAGVPRGRPADFPDLFMLRRGNKSPLLMQKRGDEIVPLFVLLKQVRIKPRLGFGKAFGKQMDVLAGKINEAVDVALKEA